MQCWTAAAYPWRVWKGRLALEQLRLPVVTTDCELGPVTHFARALARSRKRDK